MKCKKCRNEKAIANLRAHNLALCRTCYSPWFLHHTQATIDRFKMFHREDKILVAVSGGKDSLALWHALSALGYQADGLYLHLGIDHEGYSDKSMVASQTLAVHLGRPLHVANVAEEAGATIPEIQALTRRVACSGCGLTKRHLMNKIACARGYDVLTTGHNLDDEAATLLGNVLHWQMDYIGRQGPVLDERDGFKKKVKPFYFFTEKETTLYTLVNQLQYIRDECPFSIGATSLFYKEILNRLEHSAAGTKRMFLDGFLKNKTLFQEHHAIPDLKPCPVCGQPTTGDLCAFCRMTSRVRGKKLAV
ncbi:MAG: TIGR00269 family protein [Acidobacteria bacterium]|nr:TIGR00269 family protein [Acidobacteriota bacterium]MBI3656127.1 TIGR00269 family protein [Acidobacteriota bacterium]